MSNLITPDALNAVGEALYGPRWQSGLAGDLDVAVRTMQRWAKSGAPDSVRDELKALLVKRGADVAKLVRGFEMRELFGNEVTPQNIRSVYDDVEQMYLSAKADGDREEVRHWDDTMQKLLTEMSAEQRSWCLDDLAEVPESVRKELWSAIQKQEND